MKVADLIKELTKLCDGRDPRTVEVCKVVPSDDMWGADYEPIVHLETAGGEVYPLVILIK